MTDTTTIDRERIANLVEQYHQTEAREEQRRIENEVLAETVWQEIRDDPEAELVLSRSQVALIYEKLPDDAKEAKRMLRSVCVD